MGRSLLRKEVRAVRDDRAMLQGAKGGKAGKGAAHVPTEDPNTLRSRTTARVIDLISEGEIGGLVNGAQSIFFDNTPLQNADGSFNFTGVTYHTRSGLPDQDHLPGFGEVEAETGLGIQVKFLDNGKTFTNETDAAADHQIFPDSDQIRIVGHGYATGAGPFRLTTSGTLPSGLALGTDYYTILVDADHFKLATSPANALAGTAIDLRNAGAGTHSIGALSSGVTQTITDADLDAVRVTLRVPQLTFQDPTTGDLKGNSVSYVIELQQNGGGFAQVAAGTIEGKCVGPYERAKRIELPAGGAPWDIRVRRVSDDSAHVFDARDLFFGGYTEIIDAKLIYPDSALIGLEVDAQAFGGSIPSRAYEIYGIKVQVPTNYDPATRSYAGIWDGTFKIAWTDNPAWVFYDLTANRRYGLGEVVRVDQIDKWALYEIAQYCDGLVPDGFGGHEPRFTFNGYIQTQEEAYSVLQTIASNFRAMAFWANGGVTLVQDAPKDASVLVTPANVINGEFNYSGTSRKARYTVANVTWNDPADNYKPAIEVVEHRQGLIRYGFRPTDVALIGCTSRGQAHRFGKWITDTCFSETEMVNYSASFDHFSLQPGAIASIADPRRAGVRYGGRLLDASTTQVTIDQAIEIVDGLVYTLSVVMPDQTVASIQVGNVPGTHAALDLVASLADTPLKGAMWTIRTAEVNPRQFRLLGLRESAANQMEVVGVKHDPNKFLRVEQDIVLDPLDFSAFPRGEIKPPTNPKAIESLVRVNNAVRNRLSLAWEAAQDARVTLYRVFMQPPAGNWSEAGVTSTLGIDLMDVEPGTYNFRIHGVSIGGISVAAPLSGVPVLGKSAPPADVTGLVATPTVTGVELRWSPVEDIDLIGYEVRDGLSWDGATVLTEGHKGTSLFVPLADTATHSFLVRARDDSGNPSVGIASVTAAVSQPGDVATLVAVPQGEHVNFRWSVIPGIDIEYEIRAGVSWEVGEFVGKSAGDNMTALWPANGDVKFWIKARSKLGLYSTNAVFYSTALAVPSNRNEIRSLDVAAAGWNGVLIDMEVATGDVLAVKQFSGVNASRGEFYLDVDLTTSYRARNWLQTTLVLVSAGGLTWNEATFTWDSPEAASTSWFASAEGTGATVKKLISRFLGLAGEDVEGFALDGSTAGYNGVGFIDDATGVTYGPTGRFRPGAQVAAGVNLVLDVTVPLAEFTLVLNFTPGLDIAAATTLLHLETDTTGETLDLTFDPATGVLALTDEDSAVVSLAQAALGKAGEFVTVALTQDATTRGLFVACERAGTQDYASAALGPKAENYVVVALADALLTNLDGTFYDVLVKGVAKTESQLQALVADPHPLGYGPFVEFFPGDYEYQKSVIGAVVTAPAIDDRPALSQFTHNVDVPDVIDTGTASLPAGALTTLSFNKTFNEIPEVTAVQKSGATAGTVEYGVITKADFQVGIKAAGSYVAGDIMWVAKKW